MKKIESKICPKCMQNKSSEHFSKRSDCENGLMSWCQLCNREKVKKWRKLNKEKVLKYTENWRKNNRDKLNKIQKKYRFNNPKNVRASKMLLEAKKKCLKKNIPFDIDYNFILKKMSGMKCEKTGLDFIFYSNGKRGPYSPSLDRIVPEKGYIKGNVRVILWALNAFKNSWSDNEIYPIAKAFCISIENCENE